jgi:glyoxylase-like metal-dependent hydrolase (beta-lactamase superfamily II)
MSVDTEGPVPLFSGQRKSPGGRVVRIRTPGNIRDNLWFLGREESCLYLVEGNGESIILSGGLSYVVPDVLKQIEAFSIDEGNIKKLLILHAHFDHIGIVPFLKRRHPDLEIFASKRAWQLLGNGEVLETINAFGRAVARRFGMQDIYAEFDLDWREDIVGEAVGEGDRIDVGGLSVDIYETPGHSSCSLSAYIPQLRALFASDAGGIPYKDTIIPSGNSNYTTFQQSLEKLKDLHVDYACADHYGTITGDEAPDFIRSALASARERRETIEAIYRRTGDLEKTVQEMVDEFYRQNPNYFLTPEITQGVYRQMTRHIVGAMEAS